jgi:hypothetical protein
MELADTYWNLGFFINLLYNLDVYNNGLQCRLKPSLKDAKNEKNTDFFIRSFYVEQYC